MTTKFYVRGTTLYLAHYEDCRDWRISTGMRVPVGARIAADGMTLAGKDRISLSMNQQLINLMADVKTIMNSGGDVDNRISQLKRIFRNGTQDVDVLLHQYANNVYIRCTTGSLTSRSGVNYSQSFINGISAVSARLQDMADDGMELNLTQADLSNRPQSQRQKVAASTRSFYTLFRNGMKQDELSVNTQGKYMSTLLSLVAKAEEEFLFVIDKHAPVVSEDIPVVALTPEAVKEFWTIDYNRLPDSIIKFAYEVSAVILATSLRVSDAIRIKVDDLAMNSGVPMLAGYLNQKTGEQTYCPVPAKLYNILIGNHNVLGSVYSIADSDRNMKHLLIDSMPDLFKMIRAAHDPVTVTRLNPDGNTWRRETKPLYQMVKPHMLRKSAITSMLYSGVPERVIKFASGHTGNSKSFERYVSYVDKVYNQELINYQKQITGE